MHVYTCMELCTVPLSLFADPERILRRLYVFAEEPCKSTTTTSEPCSPVFKEAQPRPSKKNARTRALKFRISLSTRISICSFLLYIMCFTVSHLRIVIKAIQPDCDNIKGFSVFSWKPLSPEASTFPHSHTHNDVRELQEPSTYSRYPNQFTNKITLHWWRI